MLTFSAADIYGNLRYNNITENRDLVTLWCLKSFPEFVRGGSSWRMQLLEINHVLEKICLFVLRLNVPVNNFSVMSGWSQLLLGLTSTVGN